MWHAKGRSASNVKNIKLWRQKLHTQTHRKKKRRQTYLSLVSVKRDYRGGEPRTSKCTIDAPRDSSELNSPCFYGLCIPYWTWEASPLLHPRDLRLLTQKTTDCPGPSAPPPWEREGWSGSGRPRSPQRMVSTLCYEAGRVGCKRGDGITIYLYYNGRLMDSTRGVANDDRLFVIPLKNIDE